MLKAMAEDHKKTITLHKHLQNQGAGTQRLHTRAQLSFLEVMILKNRTMMFTCSNSNPLLNWQNLLLSVITLVLSIHHF